MSIELTKEQYKILLKAVMAGENVYGILSDSISDEYKKESDELEEFSKYILNRAGDFGFSDLVQQYKGDAIPSDKFSDEMGVVVEDYDDETFWHELGTRLGKRDFGRDMTGEERKETNKTGRLSNRVYDFYEKWDAEFEKYGVERLGIVEGKGDRE